MLVVPQVDYSHYRQPIAVHENQKITVRERQRVADIAKATERRNNKALVRARGMWGKQAIRENEAIRRARKEWENEAIRRARKEWENEARERQEIKARERQEIRRRRHLAIENGTYQKPELCQRAFEAMKYHRAYAEGKIRAEASSQEVSIEFSPDLHMGITIEELNSRESFEDLVCEVYREAWDIAESMAKGHAEKRKRELYIELVLITRPVA